jgi:hypothetical protein
MICLLIVGARATATQMRSYFLSTYLFPVLICVIVSYCLFATICGLVIISLSLPSLLAIIVGIFSLLGCHFSVANLAGITLARCDL